jgi:hypothetical protein
MLGNLSKAAWAVNSLSCLVFYAKQLLCLVSCSYTLSAWGSWNIGAANLKFGGPWFRFGNSNDPKRIRSFSSGIACNVIVL